MKLVGLVGPKGSGKDTAYDLLKDLKKTHGKISFAGPLKEICAKVFNIHVNLLHDPVLKEIPFKTPITLTTKHLRDIKHECVDRLDPIQGERVLYNPNKASTSGLEGRVLKTPRELMQFIGTDFIRERIYKEWHLRAAFDPKVLAKLPTKSGTYCVTDVRFLNEYAFLKERFLNDFVCYYVERPEAEERLANATHDSELETIKIREYLTSTIIKNDGTLLELKDKLKDLKLPEGEKPKRGFVFKPNGKQ